MVIVNLTSPPPSLCLHPLLGRQYVNESLNQREFFGNETIDYFTPTEDMLGVLHVNGSTHMKHPMALWDGFQSYNYSYGGRTAGLLYDDLESPRVFVRDHSISLGEYLLCYSLTISFLLLSSTLHLLYTYIYTLHSNHYSPRSNHSTTQA